MPRSWMRGTRAWRPCRAGSARCAPARRCTSRAAGGTKSPPRRPASPSPSGGRSEEIMGCEIDEVRRCTVVGRLMIFPGFLNNIPCLPCVCRVGWQASPKNALATLKANIGRYNRAWSTAAPCLSKFCYRRCKRTKLGMTPIAHYNSSSFSLARSTGAVICWAAGSRSGGQQPRRARVAALAGRLALAAGSMH